MRLLTMSSSVGRAITDHGSRLTLVPLMRPTDLARTIAIHLEPGDEVGEHEAVGRQLLLVVRGTGWVSGGDAVRHPIHEDEAAFFESGERHAAGTDDGMVAILVEGEFELG
jgi:hypothetical protein